MSKNKCSVEQFGYSGDRVHNGIRPQQYRLQMLGQSALPVRMAQYWPPCKAHGSSCPRQAGIQRPLSQYLASEAWAVITAPGNIICKRLFRSPGLEYRLSYECSASRMQPLMRVVTGYEPQQPYWSGTHGRGLACRLQWQILDISSRRPTFTCCIGYRLLCR